MKSRFMWLVAAVFTLTMAGLAAAQTGSATPPDVKPPSSTPGIGTGSDNKGLNTAGTKAAEKARPELEALRTRAMTLPAKEIDATEPEIDATIENVDSEAARDGLNVPDRLAKQLGMTPDALVAEKAKFGTGFGGLMIAHMLQSNDKSASPVTLEELIKMHKEGMGWGQLAHGMGLKLGEFVSAANSGGRLATGKSNQDARTRKLDSEADRGANASKGAASTMEHGRSAAVFVPGREMGKGAAAGHRK